MAKTSHQNRTRNLRRLAALAAIGLISFSGSSPAFGLDNVTSTGPVTPGLADDGLNIVSDGTADTKATWTNSLGTTTISTDADSTGLVFSDGGTAGAGDTILELSGLGLYTIGNGGIRNENTESAAIIDMQTKGSTLLVRNGDIAGGDISLPNAVLQIKSNGATLMAADSDVTGKVDLISSSAGDPSTFLVESIGEEKAATVTTRGPGQIILDVDTNFGAAGGSSLTLGGTTGTAATIGGNIGSNTTAGAPVNSIIMNGSSTLDVAGAALGTLNVKNAGSKDSFTLNTLGDSGNLSLDGRISIKKIVGETAIQAQDGATGNVYLWDDDTLSYAGLGSATDNLNLTLGADNDATSDRLNLNMGDTIRGGTGGAAGTSTTINIDTDNAYLFNKNTPGDNIDVAGHVNINLIGDSGENLVLGELTAGSTLVLGTDTTAPNTKTIRFLDGLSGDTGTDADGKMKFTSVTVQDEAKLLADTAKDNISIINTNQADKSAVIQQMQSGILNAGHGGGVDDDPDDPIDSSVWVNTVAGGANVQIGSVAGDRGQVIMIANGIAGDDGAGIPKNTHINLKNAILKITDDDDTTNSSYGLGNLKAGEFTMDSTDGESRLMSDTGDTLLIASDELAPTVTVGSGENSGNVVIQTDHLDYNAVLKSSDVAGTQGAVYFKDSATNKNKMIFISSDSTNNFNEGVEIKEGNWEFQGSTTIDAQANNYIQDSDIYFTGNSDDDPAVSTFTIAGDAIEMGKTSDDSLGTTLHINENVNIAYDGIGELKNLDTLKLGDTVANTNLAFGADTILKVAQIDTGYYDDLSGPAIMAATVDNVFISKASSPTKHPDGTAISFSSGLQGEHITLNDAVKVTGGLYIDADGDKSVLTIGRQEGGFLLTHDAWANNSYIEKDAVMDIANAAFDESNPSHTIGNGVQAIKVLGTADTDSLTATQLQELTDLIGKMAGNLKIDTDTLEALLGNNSTVKAHVTSDGTVYYDEIGRAGGGGQTPSSPPSFARPMLNALSDALANDPTNPISGAALHLLDPTNFNSSEAYNRELTQVMGNTMNSSLSLVQNGTTQAFSRLNASVPTISGYRTAQAVAAPRRAPVQAPAPSTNIGVPIRATDPVPGQPQPAAVPPAPIAPASGSDDGRPNGFWITPNYIQMSMDGNYREGYSDYDVKSMGMIMGYDKWVNENARLGAFLSYSSPKLENDFQEITADDIQMGVYAQGVMSNGVIMNAALAMGSQDYSSRRDIKFASPVVAADYNQELKADYGGRSLSAALEVSRPIALENSIVVRPSVGYSYQNISLDDIKEESNVAQGRSLAQKISSDSFNIQQARLGADIGWVNPDNTVTVNGRAFLVANMGDTQPEGTASFISAGSAMPFKVYGAELDDTMANLGLGLKFTPAGQEGLIISLDYDAMLGSNTQSHNLGLMIRYEF